MTEPKIHRYFLTPRHELIDVREVDYVRGLSVRLQPEKLLSTTVKGEVVQINFYDSATLQPDGVSVVFDDLVVREDHAYTRDSAGVAIMQTKTIRWYGEDDSEIAQKVRTKIYSLDERIAEGKTRRRNHVNEMQFTVLGMIIATEGLTGTPEEIAAQAAALGIAFFATVQSEIALYVDTGDQLTLGTAITTIDTGTEHTWLENVIDPGPPAVTIEGYLLNELA